MNEVMRKWVQLLWKYKMAYRINFYREQVMLGKGLDSDVDCESRRGSQIKFQYTTPVRTDIDFDQTTLYLKKTEIPCLKYNYTMDKTQNLDHFFATLRLSLDGKKFQINNLKPHAYKEIQQVENTEERNQDDEMSISDYKTEQATQLSGAIKRMPTKMDSIKAMFLDDEDEEIRNNKAVAAILGSKRWDDRVSIKRQPSKATCLISDIKAFIFGGSSSRFWVLRKHINSMDSKLLNDLPFYSWECLTIIMNDDQAINLVIKDQHDMTKVLEFLIVSLKTVDGFRGTATHLREEAFLQIFKRFNLMRIRMKISFMALQKLQTIKEFFMEAILEQYKKLISQGLIHPHKDTLPDDLFNRLIQGRCSLKLIAWRYVYMDNNPHKTTFD